MGQGDDGMGRIGSILDEIHNQSGIVEENRIKCSDSFDIGGSYLTQEDTWI